MNRYQRPCRAPGPTTPTSTGPEPSGSDWPILFLLVAFCGLQALGWRLLWRTW